MIATERHIARTLDYTAVFDEFSMQTAGRKKSSIDLKKRLVVY